VDANTLVRAVTGRTPNRDQDQGVSTDATVRLFDSERAVTVVADRSLEEHRWSTPDLLAVEQPAGDRSQWPDT
jgi:hypothetical protein